MICDARRAGLDCGQLQMSCVLEEKRESEEDAGLRREQPEQQEPVEEKRPMSRGGRCPGFPPGPEPCAAPLAGPGAGGAGLDSDS